MAVNNDNNTPSKDTDGLGEADEPGVRFAIETPFGTRHLDPDYLPEELRVLLVESIRADGLPVGFSKSARALLGKALNVDLSDVTEGASVPDVTLEADNESTDAAEALHVPGCSCATLHRTSVWGILDTAFPDEPHLWQAVDALFTLSAINPHPINDIDRRAALDTATMHLQRHIDMAAPPLSPTEQMVAQFRAEMDL